VGGNSQTGNSRGRESMGIPREFPFPKWCFQGIPRNSYTGEVYWLYRIFNYREVPLNCATKNAFYNIGFSEAKALFRQKLARKWGHAIARGWATLLLDRLRDFVVVPSSAGGNSSFELHSQSMEERATLDRYHHFQGHSGMCT